MYRRAMPAVDQYMAMAVTGPKTKVAKKQEDEILKKQLFEKADHLQKVEKDFVAIIDTGPASGGSRPSSCSQGATRTWARR
jgi:hypothetical protein